MRKKGTTAAELLSRLSTDPDFARRRAEQEELRQQTENEVRAAEAPLVRDLCDNGYDVDSVWSLVSRTDDYPVLVPILMDHLGRAYPAPIREGIARALAVPSARSAWSSLKSFYLREQDERVKDGLAVALAAIVDGDTIDDLIALCRMAELGPSRVLLMAGLQRLPDRRAQAALMSLGTTGELAKQARQSLRVRQQRARKRRTR